MYRNYLTIAFRNLKRYKAYSFINIAGLAIGMACCAFIFLYVQHELSYDSFHKKSDRIYQIIRETKSDDGKTIFNAGISGPFAPALLKDFPEVENAVRVWGYGDFWTMSGNRQFHNPSTSSIWYVESHFLNIFDFPMIKGSRDTALRDPYSLVLSEKTARTYFGSEDPIGKIITFTTGPFQGDFTVTGVVNVPENSSIQFDMLSGLHIETSQDSYMRGQWQNWQPAYPNRPFQVFAVLHEDTDLSQLNAKLPDFMERYMGKEVREKNTYHLHPVRRIHLFTAVDFSGELISGQWLVRADIQSVYLFSIVGFLILLIACVNFINLSTARSANRAKEVGLRKVSGAHRFQLIQQFLGEAVLLSFLAFILAFSMVELLMPKFSAFFDKDLISGRSFYHLLILVGIWAFVGLMAGIYPAFYLSNQEPIAVLKGSLKIGLKGILLRRGLVIFQFSISILLIISVVTIYSQLNYLKNKNLGFHQDHLVQLPIFWRDIEKKTGRGDYLSWRYQTVKQAFLSHPNILKATAYRYNIDGWGGTLREIYTEPGNTYQVLVQDADEGFLETFQMDLIAGRTFQQNEMGVPNRVIINETAVKLLGWEDPIGKQIVVGKQRTLVTIVGVVKDFHSQSLHSKIKPLVITNNTKLFKVLALKINGQNVPETLEFLEDTWKRFLPDRPFEFWFIDESIQKLYEKEQRLGQLVSICAALAICVACLGLFGLAAFTAEQRTKEIGVRKVLGASISSIMLLLSKEFIRLVLIAAFIAYPVAYFTLGDWLESFPYRVELSWWIFAFSGIVTLFVALITVSHHAIRVALTNPVDALRDE